MSEKREYTLYIGPNHPGIEGNYALRLSLEGDIIKKCNTEGGFLHRGFEKLMEQRLWIQNIAIVCRICVPDPDPNENNYARCIEALSGMEIPERAKFIRSLVLELSRIGSHLFTLGGIAATTGIYTMPNWSIAARDRILELFEALTGGRVYHLYTVPGGVRRDLPNGFKDKVLKTMDYIEARLPEYDSLVFENPVFVQRTRGTAVISKETALEWGVTGPNLRACGIAEDVRKNQTYEAYDQIDFNIPTFDGGDCYDRARIRRAEIAESINIVRQLINKMPEGPVWAKIPNPLKWKVPAGEVFIRTESSKGEYGYYMVSDGGRKPYRVNVKGASMTHGTFVLENMLKGARIEDASLIMFSLDACPPEIDR